MSNFRSKFTALAISMAVVLSSSASTVSADAFEGLSMMRMGSWEVDFSGNANSFVVFGECDPDEDLRAVAHGLACGSNGVEEDHSNIRTGLLPSWFNFSASTTTPGGWKTGAHLSFQPGGDSGNNGTNSLDQPLGLNTSNFRQIFATLSHADYGTFKIGRDLGVFGSNAILEDQTLLGVGAPSVNSGATGGNTTLGRIGFGYIYADWKAQLQYTTPSFNGLSATFALVDPWGASSLAGADSGRVDAEGDPVSSDLSTSQANRQQEKDTFGFEAKLNYAWDAGGGISGHFWASFATQDVDWELRSQVTDSAIFAETETCRNAANPAAPIEQCIEQERDASVDAYDIGAKIVIDDFDFVAYYYDGEGIGTTGYLIDGIDRLGEERDSDGYYLQARWRTPISTLIGISYGESELDLTRDDERRLNQQLSAEASLADPDTPDVTPINFNLVESNELFVFGLYHPIGEGMNLVAEYSHVESEAHNGNSSDEDVLSFGAIIFF